MDDLLLVHSLYSVVFPLYGNGHLHDVLNDLLDNLLNWIWDFNMFDLFHRNPHDFDDWVGNIIGDFNTLLNNSVHLVGDRSVHHLLHRVGNLNLDWVRSWDWGGNRDIAGHNLFNNLLHRVWNRLVNQSGHGYGDLNRHSDGHGAGNLDDLLNDLFHGIWNLSFD
jgi:hypothetical protein